ncbi:hypothetical protein BH11PSE9_BH11PSE9_13480 [soil metagenome]
MYRCALAAAVAATLIAPAFVVSAQAQMQRTFPQNALRGAIVIGQPPEITLNGKNAMLAPGSRIRDQNNMIAMSAGLSGSKLLVNYTVDTSGLVKDVWILRAEEAAVKPWPATLEQAQTWVFDPTAQTWSKP